MNILHLQTYLDYTCGVTNHIYLIANNVTDGKKHFIVTFGGDAIDKFKGKNIEVVSIKKDSLEIFTVIKVYNKLRQVCNSKKIDIIHSHHRYFDLIASIYAKGRNIKTVMTVHSKVGNLRKLSYKADNLIAVSNSVKENLVEKYLIDEKKIKIIRNLIDPEEAKLKYKKQDIINKYKLFGEFIIGFIGRFSIEEKGVDVLLNAYKCLCEDKNNTCLVFIGNGKDEKYIKDYAKENNLNIRVIPPQRNIFDFINICDLIVLPSRIDPFPYIMLEAGLMKKAFIGARIDGIAEFIEDGKDGILFEKENYKELSEKIILLMEQKELSSKLAESLYKKVIENYSKDKLIESYNTFYNEIIKS